MASGLVWFAIGIGVGLLIPPVYALYKDLAWLNKETLGILP